MEHHIAVLEDIATAKNEIFKRLTQLQSVADDEWEPMEHCDIFTSRCAALLRICTPNPFFCIVSVLTRDVAWLSSVRGTSASPSMMCSPMGIASSEQFPTSCLATNGTCMAHVTCHTSSLPCLDYTGIMTIYVRWRAPSSPPMLQHTANSLVCCEVRMVGCSIVVGVPTHTCAYR